MSDCQHPCTNEFDNLIQIETFGGGLSAAAQVVMWLSETGRAGRFVHFAREGMSNYEQTCALEDALDDAGVCRDWAFVVGTIEGDAETKAWLEYRDEIVLMYGPERKRAGSDMGIWTREAWDETEHHVQAVAAAGPESGIVLNRTMKALGHGLLGES